MLEHLRQLEFCRARFVFEFEEPFLLQKDMPLRLRRELHRGARTLQEEEPALAAGLAELLEPEQTVDPYALRRFQKPSPLFVLRPGQVESRRYDSGGRFTLPVNIFGNAIGKLPLFVRLLQALGRIGFYRGEGKFELVDVSAQGHAGEYTPIWTAGDRPEALAPPLLDAGWLQETAYAPCDWSLRFSSPARLLSSGRPLFRPAASDLLRFVMRRVTALAYYGCNVELIDNAGDLLVDEPTIRANRLEWRDWRSLQQEDRVQELGGVAGDLVFAGPLPEDIFALLLLGSECNIGKNAAYGQGQYEFVQISSTTPS